MNTTTAETFDSWRIRRRHGHQRYAGHVTEQTIAGAAFLRVDVPTIQRANGAMLEIIPGFTKFLPPQSIHSISPTTEEIIRAYLSTTSAPPPVSRCDLPTLAPPRSNEMTADDLMDELTGEDQDE